MEPAKRILQILYSRSVDGWPDLCLSFYKDKIREAKDDAQENRKSCPLAAQGSSIVHYIFPYKPAAAAGYSPDAMGLTWERHNDLCMLVMLLGPIYTTIIAKIILLFVNRHMIAESDEAETGRGISMAIAGILLMADLADSRTIGDLASGYVQGKGLDNLRKSRRYPLKGKGFLNLFLPFCAYLLILEILTLLTCIILFEPLSAGASGGFILAIGITVILLLIVPLIMTFVSGFQGDKAHHEEKLEKAQSCCG